MASGIKSLIFAQSDFPAFLEQEIGLRMVCIGEGKYKSHCPFPYHRDNNPSFSVDYRDGGYKWYCYGCGEGGTIVEFFQKFYSIGYSESIRMICEKLKIGEDFDSVMKSMHRVQTSQYTHGRDLLHVRHLDLCRQCRTALRSHFEDRNVLKEVRLLLVAANEALENEDHLVMRNLSEKARKLAS